VTNPVTVKAQPRTEESASSNQAGAGATEHPVKTPSISALNVEGTWDVPNWGELILLQPAGGQEIIGKGAGYYIRGTASETNVTLNFMSEGEIQLSAEFTPNGSGIFSGKYSWGPMSSTSKTKPMELIKILNAFPPARVEKNDSNRGLNMGGTWYAPDVGKLQFIQPEEGQEFFGETRGYDIYGFVTPTK
jgi:hypothetical protein